MSGWSKFWNKVWNGITSVGESRQYLTTSGAYAPSYYEIKREAEQRTQKINAEKQKLERLRKENKLKKDTNVISPKDYYRGKDTFQKAGKDSKIRQLWTDEERAALLSPSS